MSNCALLQVEIEALEGLPKHHSELETHPSAADRDLQTAKHAFRSARAADLRCVDLTTASRVTLSQRVKALKSTPMFC